MSAASKSRKSMLNLRKKRFVFLPFLFFKDPYSDPGLARIRIRIQHGQNTRIRPDPDPKHYFSASHTGPFLCDFAHFMLWLNLKYNSLRAGGQTCSQKRDPAHKCRTLYNLETDKLKQISWENRKRGSPMH